MSFDDRRKQQPESAQTIRRVDHQLDVLLKTGPLGDPTDYLIEFTQDARPVIEEKIIVITTSGNELTDMARIAESFSKKFGDLSEPARPRKPDYNAHSPLTHPLNDLELRKRIIARTWGSQQIRDDGIAMIDLAQRLFEHHFAAKMEVLLARQTSGFKRTPPPELTDPHQQQEWLLNEAIKFAEGKAKNLQRLTGQNETLTRAYTQLQEQLKTEHGMHDRDIQIFLKLLFLGDYEFLQKDYADLLNVAIPLISQGAFKDLATTIRIDEFFMVSNKQKLGLRNWQPDLRNRFIKSVTGNFTQI